MSVPEDLEFGQGVPTCDTRLRRVEHPDDDLEVRTKDEPPPEIPGGKYQANCVGWEKRRYFGGVKLYVWFEIIDGPHMGARLYRAFNFSDRLGSATDLYKTLVMLYGKRVRKNTRLSLKLFNNKVLEVEVRVVTSDHKQNALPEHQRYAVIDRIVGVLAGGGAPEP